MPMQVIDTSWITLILPKAIAHQHLNIKLISTSVSLGPSCWPVFSSSDVPGSLPPLCKLFSLPGPLSITPFTLSTPTHSFSPSSRSPSSEKSSFIFTLRFRSKSCNKCSDRPHAVGYLSHSLQCLPPDMHGLVWHPPLECKLDLATCLQWIEHGAGDKLSLPGLGYLKTVASVLLNLSLSLSLPPLFLVRETSSHVVSSLRESLTQQEPISLAIKDLSLLTTTRVSLRCHSPSDLNHWTQLSHTHSPDPETEK